MKVEFTTVSSECGDWQALYIDGKLAAEGHSLNVRDVLDCINAVLPNEVNSMEIPDEVAEMGMPMYLDDLNR